MIQSRSGQYLNSFYYSLVLYHMYHENPEKIITAINQVLDQKMTTMDMLKQLHLYHTNNDQIFDQEITRVKKQLLVKK